MSENENKNEGNDPSQLKYIIEPESIAIIGASDNSKKWGGKIVKNLKKGFIGKIFPVNPKKDEILGLKCFKSVLDIPSEYDVKTAVITIPANIALQAVEECGQRGIKGIIMITAGFAETGTTEGKKLQKELDEIVQRYEMRYSGPNCLGLINPYIGMNASNVDGGEKIKPGNVACYFQSGTIALDTGHKAREMGIGISTMISVGNSANVSIEDLVEYSINDPKTNVIAIYSEGIKDGRRFMRLAESTNKHIIVLKVGRTEAGSKAASSHTASMAGSDDVYTAAFKQAGIIRVENVTELLSLAYALSNQPLPESIGIGITSNGGGPLIIKADRIERSGIKIQEFSEETQKKIRKLLPEHINHTGNLLDMGGITPKERFQEIVETVINDENMGGAIVSYVQEPETAEIILNVYKKSKKPIMLWWAGNSGGETRKELEESGVPVFDDADFAAKIMVYIIRRGEYLRKKAERKNIETAPMPIKRNPVPSTDVWELLKEYGIPILPSELAKTSDDAIKIANRFGYPVAMKISSPDISHKSDVGGVAIDLNSEIKVIFSFNRMVENVKNKLPNARIDGVIIQGMAKPSKEFIVGAKRDSSFGSVIVCGTGGTDTELIKDLSMRVAPVDREMASDMIKEINFAPYFFGNGYRGKKLNREKIIDVIVAISKIMEANDNISTIEINPLTVSENDVIAVDARMFVK